MAYSNQERNHAHDIVAQLIGRGRSVRTSLSVAATLTGISYQTLSRWHYEIKERPTKNSKMAEMGICFNRKQAMLGRRGALDRMCRLYRRISGNNEDMETLRHHGFANESRYGSVAQLRWDAELDYPLMLR